jgi:CRP-like cAMP-binding protein
MAMLLGGHKGGTSFLPDRTGVGHEGPVAQTPLLQGLSPDELKALIGSGASHRIPRQQVVFCAGETLGHFYMVLAGSFKLIRQSTEGKELIVALARRGEFFGALAEPIESRSAVQAVEDSALWAVPVAAMRRTLAQNPDFAIRLLHFAQRRQDAVETTATRLAFESVAERLAHLLLDVANPRSGELDTPLNQTEIANLIGSSRETVCSILNQFRRRGLLTINRGQLRVTDRERLSSTK